MKYGLAWIGEELRYFGEMRVVGKRKPRVQVKIVKGKDRRVWCDVEESAIKRKPDEIC